MHIIIANDSRERGIPDHLQRHQTFLLHWEVSMVIRPGATNERLTEETEKILNYKKNDENVSHVLFLIGICNVTEIKSIIYTEIKYNSLNKVEKNKKTIQIIHQT